MEDARFERCGEAIRQALLRLLVGKRIENVSMSELAREAGVSRSTLYAHYGNVQDVYAALVDSNGDLNAAYTDDGLHLLGEGYQVWKEAIRPYVK